LFITSLTAKVFLLLSTSHIPGGFGRHWLWAKNILYRVEKVTDLKNKKENTKLKYLTGIFYPKSKICGQEKKLVHKQLQHT